MMIKGGLSILLIAGMVALVYLLWAYVDVFIVIAAIALFCFAGYQSGKMRRQ